MTSFRQFEANRRNALRSTGPRTEDGKQRSRLNAVRHGLTAETVVGSLEDAEDYKAFEATIIADYCPETAVARELVLRLASLLWRLRRATAIETDLFEIQAEELGEHTARKPPHPDTYSQNVAHSCKPIAEISRLRPRVDDASAPEEKRASDKYRAERLQTEGEFALTTRQLTNSFLLLAKLDGGIFERLNRYEVRLWRQAVQILFVLHPIRLR
jgi:hypothetical protein